MSHRIAIVFEGDISNRMGVFNAVLCRAAHLRKVADYEIDIHMIQVYDGRAMSLFRGTIPTPAQHRPAIITAQGMTVNMHWFQRSSIDALGHRLLHREPKRFLSWLASLGEQLTGYDLVSAHDRIAAHVARACARKNGIPYAITWHGTSIHTDPVRDTMLKRLTTELLRDAPMNCFVSKDLEAKARLMAGDIACEVLYNGASDRFTRYTDAKRADLRAKHGVGAKKTVAFVGRFEPVKNVTMLPNIFARVKQVYDKTSLAFWAFGDGTQLQQVKQAMSDSGVECTFWGVQPLVTLPQFMNCIDVLVLPSRLEGLPLVAVEALRCGANVAAADVGGCIEVVGADNVVPHGEDFIDRFALRVSEMLQGHVVQPVSDIFSWDKTAEKEHALFQRLIAASQAVS